MKSANVEKLHPDQQDEQAPAPALGFSIQQDIGGGQNIVLQTHLPNDVSIEALNGMLDKMSKAASRLRARHELGRLTAECEKEAETFERMRADEARLCAEKEREIAREEEILKQLISEHDRTLDEGRDAHVAAGRGGEYRPDGHRKSRLNATSAAIDKQKSKIEQIKQSFEAEKQNYRVTLGQWEKVMAKYERDITTLKEVSEV